MAPARWFPSSAWRNSRWWNPANLLTFSRLILAPFAVGDIVSNHPRRAFLLIFIAGWTDLFDGLVARATASNPDVGQLLDPIADKFLLSGVFLGLAWIKTVPVWFVAVVFGRDFLLLLASAWVLSFTSYTELKPDVFGKASTVLQIFAAGFFVLANAISSGGTRTFAMWLLWPTALLTLLSGLRYGWRGLAYFRRQSGAERQPR